MAPEMLEYLEDEWTVKLAEHMSRNAQLRVDVKQAERRAKEAERRAEEAEAALAAANARIAELSASLEAHVHYKSDNDAEGQPALGGRANKRRRHQGGRMSLKRLGSLFNPSSSARRTSSLESSATKSDA